MPIIQCEVSSVFFIFNSVYLVQVAFAFFVLDYVVQYQFKDYALMNVFGGMFFLFHYLVLCYHYSS